MSGPWGVDPNSQHQLWSHWTFRVAGGRALPAGPVRENAARWLRKGFGSVGQARVRRTLAGWIIEARVEGVPAEDPAYVVQVRKAFRKFVEQGWGPMAVDDVGVRILAGGDGRKQLVVMPGLHEVSV